MRIGTLFYRRGQLRSKPTGVTCTTMKRPVFVDSTGRRRRAAIILGSGLGVLLITGLIVLMAGLFSGSPVKLPGWPDAAPDAAPSVAPQPQPSVTSRKPATTGPATPTVSTTGPGNGNGNGQGNSHRPSKPTKP